jgi:hypothetical protein
MICLTASRRTGELWPKMEGSFQVSAGRVLGNFTINKIFREVPGQ